MTHRHARAYYGGTSGGVVVELCDCGATRTRDESGTLVIVGEWREPAPTRDPDRPLAVAMLVAGLVLFALLAAWGVWR